MATRTSTASSSRANEEVTFFDLITTGIGYLNRVREVHPDDGDSYTCCKINALVGPSNKVAYREIDLKVVGSQALDALDVITQATPHKDAKVIVSFRMGDAKPDSYVIQADDGRGNQRPNTRYCFKGRLLKITSCKIDGQPIDLPGLDDDETASGSSGLEGRDDLDRDIDPQPQHRAKDTASDADTGEDRGQPPRSSQPQRSDAQRRPASAPRRFASRAAA